MPTNRTAEFSPLYEMSSKLFQAESRHDVGALGWREFMSGALSDRFVIRRSRADLPNEDREQTLQRMAQGPAVERTVVEEERKGWSGGALGAVVTPVDMRRDDGLVHRYQNVQLFERDGVGNWKCAYWQVTEAPAGNPSST